MTDDVIDIAYHEIANILPLLAGPEMDELVRDIKANGLLHPIVIFDGKILDGRNRYRAMKLAGLTLESKHLVTTPDMTWNEALQLVISENLNRRHLSPGQRAFAALNLSNLRHGSNQHRQQVDAPRGASTSEPASGSAAIGMGAAAKLSGTSRRGVVRASQVKQHGVPELEVAVLAEEVTLTAAELLTQLPPEEQKRVLAQGPVAVKKTAEKLRQRDKVREPKESTKGLTEAQKVVRGKAKFENILGDLMANITTVKKLVGQLAAGGTAVTPQQWVLLKELGDQFVTVGQWINTLAPATGVDGVVTDAAIASLIDGESK